MSAIIFPFKKQQVQKKEQTSAANVRKYKKFDWITEEDMKEMNDHLEEEWNR